MGIASKSYQPHFLELRRQPDFEYIDVSENFLTGSISPDMCKNGKIFDILMLQNKFTDWPERVVFRWPEKLVREKEEGESERDEFWS